MKIIQYENKYRDDLIYMVLSAKDAIGRTPRINDDLLDIQYAFEENKCYIERNLVQIKIFIEILVNRAIMSKSNY